MKSLPLLLAPVFFLASLSEARVCKTVFEKLIEINRIEESHPLWNQERISEQNKKVLRDLADALLSRAPVPALRTKAVIQTLQNNLIAQYQRNGIPFSPVEAERVARELAFSGRFQKLFGYNPETFPMTLEDLSKQLGLMLKEGSRALSAHQRLPLLPASLPVPEGYEKTVKEVEKLLASSEYRTLTLEDAIGLARKTGNERDLALLKEYDRVETLLERNLLSKIAPVSADGRNFPYGFDSRAEYDQFGSVFRDRVSGALKTLVEQPEFYVYGSSIRGYSGRRKLGPFGQEIARKPFSGRKSDLDVAVVVSDKEFETLVSEGKLSEAEKGRSRPLKPEFVRELRGTLKGSASALVRTILPEIRESGAGRELEVENISISIYSKSTLTRHQNEGEVYFEMGGK